VNMRLIRLYYRTTRLLRSLLPEEEREFLEIMEQIGTEQAVEEIQHEWSHRKGESK
jgi:hypothetical protein